MPLMLAALYDALLEAGASEGKAREAAEEAAVLDTQFAELRQQMTALDAKVTALDTKVLAVDAKVTWIGTTVLTLTVLVLGGVLSTLWVLARH